MQHKRLSLSIALISSMMALGGCGGSSGGGGGGGEEPDTLADRERGNSECPDWAFPRDQVNGDNVCEIIDDIGASDVDGNELTMDSDTRWILAARIELGNGNEELESADDADNLVLNVEPGTNIYGGEPRSWLVITRGSRIEAEGERNNPITFSSLDDWTAEGSLDEAFENDDFSGDSEWGGLVLQGFAPNNQQSEGNFNVNAEADLGFFGGNDKTDNSGTVKYVRITEGGFEVAEDEELNGLTLFGAGSGTTLEYIQVNDNLDDGIEFFGGTANARYLVLTDNLDDSLDFDQGWQGNFQYALIARSGESDRGIESDNDGDDFDNTPNTRPTIANITILSESGDGFAAMHREGMAGYIHNSVYTGADVCLDIDEERTANNVSQNQTLAYNNVVLDCANTYNDDEEEAGSQDYAERVKNEEPGIVAITENDASLNASFQSKVTDSDIGVTDGVLSGPVDFPNTPDNADNTADGDFLDNTDYVGAVDPELDPATTDFWYEGWTLEGTLDGRIQ